MIWNTDWDDYVIRDEEYTIIGIKDDAPGECKKEYEQYIDMLKRGIK